MCILAAVLVASCFAGIEAPPAPSSQLEMFRVLVVADGEQVARDEKTRAALASAYSRLQSLAFDKQLKVVLASSYLSRATTVDVLTTGRDNILLATPSYAYRQVGTVFKKWEVTTTIIFSDLMTFQPVKKLEATSRHQDWSQAFADGMIECFARLTSEYPGFNYYKTRTFKNSLLDGPSREALISRLRESTAPHPLEGPWRVINDSHFGKFEIFVTQERNAAGEIFLAGTIVDPMYSGRTVRRLFLSMDLEPKGSQRSGLASEESLAINYAAKVRVQDGSLIVDLEDIFWKNLPPVVLARPTGWNPSVVPSQSAERRVASVPSASKAEPEADVVARSSGSGFLVSRNGVVATNYHVIEGAKRILVSLPDFAPGLEADVLAVDSRNDLALVKIRLFPKHLFEDRLPYTIRSTQAVQAGARVFTIGYPLSSFLGSKPKFSDGSISSVTGPSDDPRLLQMTASIQPGNSGGPLFNNTGDIVGVVVASANAKVFFEELGVIPQNVNFAVKSDLLLGLLFSEKIRPEIEGKQNGTGASLEEIAEKLSRYCARLTIEK